MSRMPFRSTIPWRTITPTAAGLHEHHNKKQHQSYPESFHRAALLFKQPPRNSRRNLLPMKCINRSLLMGHEHVSRALVELMQIRKTPSGTDRVLQHPPEAFDVIVT